MFKKILGKLNFIVLPLVAVFGLYTVLGSNLYAQQEIVNTAKKTFTIGIVMPMDHAALRDIVAGFKESLTKELNQRQNVTTKGRFEIEFKVKNAQGDMNTQRSILQQFQRQKVDLIVPIGTNATQMAVSLVKTQPIVSLAASYAEEARLKEQSKNITGVVDEIGPEKPLEFLSKVLPDLKKITLIYSNTEKVFPEIEAAHKFANAKGIKIQKLMIQALPELYTVSRLIDKDSQAIFILKDHLIVSGIKTLVKASENLNIPLVSSDEGSVKEGAAFSLGVRESDIGVAGGALAAHILSGQDISAVPIKILDNLSVFVNPASCQAQRLDIQRLRSITIKDGYGLIDSASASTNDGKSADAKKITSGEQ